MKRSLAATLLLLATLAPPLRAQSRDTILNGLRLWYQVAGKAEKNVPPVVFLHGGPGQGSHTFQVMAGPYIEPHMRIVYFDQRASGRSAKPSNSDYALATLVEDIEALRKHLGVPRIAVLGHSFGGLLALEYAATYPQRVSHMIFVAGLYDVPTQCRFRREVLKRLRPEAYARVDTLNADGTRRSDCEYEFTALRGAEREKYNLEIMFPDPAISARQDSIQAASGMRNTGELGNALFSGGLLKYAFSAYDKVTMPSLVIAGKHDGAAVSAGIKLLADRLPNARFYEFEKSGHFVYYDEPERFARLIAAFIRGKQAK
jgi:proline iminopeptidase